MLIEPDYIANNSTLMLPVTYADAKSVTSENRKRKPRFGIRNWKQGTKEQAAEKTMDEIYNLFQKIPIGATNQHLYQQIEEGRQKYVLELAKAPCKLDRLFTQIVNPLPPKKKSCD